MVSQVKFYEELSAAASPVVLADMKTYLKITSSADDTLIQALIDSCTEFGENYTGRDFRVKDWRLSIDFFQARIVLDRNPVASITTAKYLVSDALVTIASTVYYLKKLTQCAEILLQENQSWPIDIDDREQAIEIEFKTEAYYKDDQIIDAIKRNVLFAYENRGDCDTKEAAQKSGAALIYDQFRISRI